MLRHTMTSLGALAPQVAAELSGPLWQLAVKSQCWQAPSATNLKYPSLRSAYSTVAGDYQAEKLNPNTGRFEREKKVTHDDGSVPAPHPSKLMSEKGADYLLMHPVYTHEYMESIKPQHKPPQKMVDKAAYYSIQTIRSGFDLLTGYGPNMTTHKWLNRVVFLETVAGVPGMVAGMIRHLHSLRLMRRDHGWIHTLLEEAENERMHLLTFLKLREPGLLFRGAVLVAQGIFCNLYFLSYLVSPRYCHSLVGYLEEEAVKTYTHLLHDIDSGKLPEWENAPAPEIAKAYWHMPEGSTMRDLFLNVRADEACHSHVNHTFAGMKPTETNPFTVGSHQVP